MSLPVDLAAYVVVAGMLVLALFRAAIAPVHQPARASWAATSPGRLPRNVRIASAVSVVAYLVAALNVLDRASAECSSFR